MVFNQFNNNSDKIYAIQEVLNNTYCGMEWVS